MHRTSASARYNGEVLAAAAGVEALYSITNMQAPLIKYHLTLNVAESYICTSSCTPAVARAAMVLHSKYPFAGSATKRYMGGAVCVAYLPFFHPFLPLASGWVLLAFACAPCRAACCKHRQWG
jgi:hypothetical protein